jgi:catechol 2,3-dioxygenase-like lactoylglutathione lyase family enzyme
MERKPVTAIRAAELARSVRFYREMLGFTLNWQDDRAGGAQVTPQSGRSLLLAGPALAEVGPYMHEIHVLLPPGGRIYCGAPGPLPLYRDSLRAAGLQAELRENEDGSRVLELSDPDGYLVSFWEAPRLTDDEVLDRFEQAPQFLAAALDGLQEQHLDLARGPGKWTIRQTVHHMADSAGSSLVRLLMALAEPGRPFRHNPYSQDRWVAGLDAAGRPIETSVLLLTAVHRHVAALARHLRHADPPALDRSLETDLAGTVTVRETMQMLGGHVHHHVAQIRQTREVHGV